jgi:hypothetical protein
VLGAVCEGILRSAHAAGVGQIFIENLLVVFKKGRGGAAPPFGLPEIFLKQRQPEQEKSVGAHFSYCANLGWGAIARDKTPTCAHLALGNEGYSATVTSPF